MRTMFLALVLMFGCHLATYAPSPPIPMNASQETKEQIYQTYKLKYPTKQGSWQQNAQPGKEFELSKIQHLLLRYPSSAQSFQSYQKKNARAFGIFYLGGLTGGSALLGGFGLGRSTAGVVLDVVGSSVVLSSLVFCVLGMVDAQKELVTATNQYNDALQKELGLQNSPTSSPTSQP
jgi:hypothetical protein